MKSSEKSSERRNSAALKIRRPGVAGMFYPIDPAQLTTALESYLSAAERVIDQPIAALIAPHAGYLYSGPVAAWSYKQIEGRDIPLVIVLAPSHFAYFRGASVYDGDAYLTPLGEVPVDRDAAWSLSEQDDLIHFSDAGHSTEGPARPEHALEVQLPFLQKVLGDFKLLPVIIGDMEWDTCRALAKGISQIMAETKALVVASSDLSHYHKYEVANEMDHKFMETFQEYDCRNLLEQSRQHRLEACGAAPIATAMLVGENRGFRETKILKHATSGDVPYGEKDRVVGYLAAAIYRKID